MSFVEELVAGDGGEPMADYDVYLTGGSTVWGAAVWELGRGFSWSGDDNCIATGMDLVAYGFTGTDDWCGSLVAVYV